MSAAGVSRRLGIGGVVAFMIWGRNPNSLPTSFLRWGSLTESLGIPTQCAIDLRFHMLPENSAAISGLPTDGDGRRCCLCALNPGYSAPPKRSMRDCTSFIFTHNALRPGATALADILRTDFHGLSNGGDVQYLTPASSPGLPLSSEYSVSASARSCGR